MEETVREKRKCQIHKNRRQTQNLNTDGKKKNTNSQDQDSFHKSTVLQTTVVSPLYRRYETQIDRKFSNRVHVSWNEIVTLRTTWNKDYLVKFAFYQRKGHETESEQVYKKEVTPTEAEEISLVAGKREIFESLE